MQKIRVMLVDDSVVIRRMLSEILAADPDIEVAGTAGNGRIALQKLTQIQPDVVVMDIEMPVLSGLETLPELRKTHPKLPVIMFSTLTTSGGRATLDALALGATDYVTKPANVGSVGESIERIRHDLVPRIKTFGRRSAAATAPLPAALAPRPQPRAVRPAGSGRVDAVVIAVSTGGPKALQEVIPKLPASMPVPVLVVQHMPPLFTQLLADRLDSHSQVHAEEATHNRAVEPGLVLIAPGDHHMVLNRVGTGVVAQLNQDPPENSCRPSADPLFRSAARVYGPNTLGVVLTGMGSDGCLGAKSLIEAGGQVFAQDEATSVVWGMPGFVVRAGLADAQVPLAHVADEIVRRVSVGRSGATASSLGRTGQGA
jgi:two-component system chemotaxis response regulator CheB